MAMLAEPRQRKRYNLNPRGKALYEDDSRFGTKMLEKMGWSKGKGLGAKENGDKDFVRVRYKKDSMGFGFQERDDQWTQHEDQFNTLLNSFKDPCDQQAAKHDMDAMSTVGFGFKTETKKEKIKDKISGQSLEEMSKNSKARVHYKKFTRGKDVARYSEKDLANIFGKKAEDDQQFIPFTAIVPEFPKEDDTPKDEKDTSQTGVQMVQAGISIDDYFKKKMEERKQGLSGNSSVEKNKIEDNITKFEDSGTYDQTDCLADSSEPQKKKKKSKKRKAEEDSALVDINDSECQKDKQKPKRNKAKSVEEEIKLNVDPIDSALVEINDSECRKDKQNTKRNKAKSVEEETKLKVDPIVENTTSEQDNSDWQTVKPKKKKKNKDKSIIEEQESESVAQVIENDTEWQTVKQKKSKRHTDNPVEEGSSVPELPIVAQGTNTENDTTNESIRNEYCISSFCAEKFRHTNINEFLGSNIAELVGYGLNDNFSLKIKQMPEDMTNIAELWNCTKDYSTPTPMANYCAKVYEARKENKPLPKMMINQMKRKRAFGGIYE